MATSKTKTGATLVSTVGRNGNTYKFTSRLMIRVGSNSRFLTRFATKNEIFNVINKLFRGGESIVGVVVYSGTTGRNTFEAQKNDYGGFSIGCQNFDRNTVRAIAANVGHNPSFIKTYLPRAAAGR